MLKQKGNLEDGERAESEGDIPGRKMRRGGATVVKRARIRSARPDSLPRSTMISADYEEMGEAGERLGEVCYWKLGFRSRPHAGPRPQRASLRTPTRCGSASCGHSSGPLVISGGEPLAYPCSPKRNNTDFHTQKAPPLFRPKLSSRLAAQCMGR